MIPVDRIFLRKIIDLSTKVKSLHHRIRITLDASLDCSGGLILYHNGQVKGRSGPHVPSYIQPYTNASGTYGLGANWCGRWLQRHWSKAQMHMDIMWKELLAIVVVEHAWGSYWRRQKMHSCQYKYGNQVPIVQVQLLAWFVYFIKNKTSMYASFTYHVY